MDGWIKLYREIRDNPFWKDKPFSYGQAWVDLLLLANHKDNKIMFDHNIIEIKRGSFITSELKLMDSWGWSKTKVRHFLKNLSDEHMIIKETDRKKTTITIVNYDFFQDLQTTEKPKKNPREANQEYNSQYINNNIKNEKNDNECNKRSNSKDINSRDIQAVIDSYNAICISCPRVKRITDDRAKKIKARLKEYSFIEIEDVFAKVEKSDFLNGTKTDFKADFDWIINVNNMVKIIEGKYDNNSKAKKDNEQIIFSGIEA